MKTAERIAMRWRVQGRVQGVGFRPFVCRLARGLGLAGWVRNDPDAVSIHAEGSAEELALFEQRLCSEAPAAAQIAAVACRPTEPSHVTDFEIRACQSSTRRGVVRPPPDRAMCPSCQAEIADHANRRFHYPFTTCTDCGPRYTILHALPYDRSATSMNGFALCAACRLEYAGADERRFAAETIACPACGPQATFCDRRNRPQAYAGAALTHAVRLLRAGRILALKGLGGFQLLVRADSSVAVGRLRLRKHRPFKPLAVMVASLAAARNCAHVDAAEARLLTSPENPIVLLKRLTKSPLAVEVSPRLQRIGLMLPTTPLHALLLAELGLAVVATSGNRGEEPIVIDQPEALADIADGFLIHDRPIVRRADDSVVTVVSGAALPIRLARGYCPLPLPHLERWAHARGLAGESHLATGGQQKVAPAVWAGGQALLGPHVGDLGTVAAQDAFCRLARELPALAGTEVGVLAADLHPDYFTTRWATSSGLPLEGVQHHHAHAVACMVEHDLLDREVLALTWDGTGYASDGVVWGGETLRVTLGSSTRVASVRPFRLLGGEAAVRQPRRVALAVLADALGEDTVLGDADLLRRLGLERTSARTLLRAGALGIGAPWTSSMGRLFDAAAALILGVGEVSSEGEAAAWLEACAAPEESGGYPLPLAVADNDASLPRGDWRPLFRALLAHVRMGVTAPTCAARFHNALTEYAAAVAQLFPLRDVVLSGGCFLNVLLTERVEAALTRLGRRVFRHSLVPPGDGGLAVGQLAVALARRKRGMPGSKT